MLLLHVSDFHFGPKSRFADLAPAEFAKRFAADLKHQLGELKLAGGIDVVVATGDFAESGTRPEFLKAGEFLRALSQELGLPPLRFVLLPGNHDISWAACRGVENEQEELGHPDAKRDELIQQRKLAQYDRMVAEFYSPSALSDLARPLAGGGWLYDFPELGLSVAALNSCEKETHRPGERYGFLSTAQSQSVLDIWKSAPEGFRVLALHHPPVPVVQENVDWWRKKAASEGIGADQVERFIADLNGIQGSSELRNLAEQAGAQLVLHGHQHAGDTNHWASGYCHVLSAGSLCLVTGELPPDQPPGFKLIELLPRRNKAKVWSFAFTPRELLPGQVKKGMFRPDTAEPQPRELPIKAPKAAKAARAEWALGVAQKHFLKVYRKAFEADFDRWDLSASGVTTAEHFRNSPAALDTMYLPLRLASGWNPQQLFKGEVLEPEELLQRGKALLIRGQAGAGKTTWVRHSFRQLIRDSRAFPLLLMLRDLALSWKPEVKGEERSLLSYLQHKIAERLAGLSAGQLKVQSILATEHGPRPILLVDGWDEIGPLGEEIRSKLRALMGLYPRLLVVVTSRPFDAGGRPSHSDGFDEIDIQPLNDGEVGRLTSRFFRHRFGADESRVTSEVALFEKALEHSDEACELARTPLLLTMMLGMHSIEPLPEKRHLLYGACIRNLLSNLPERKQSEGAQLGLDQWCPDSEERLRAVAALAFSLKEVHDSTFNRSAIVARRSELLELLPRDGAWQGKQDLFLNWLVGTAGLLSDRADGTLAFSHLSFQEYLAAFHLKARLASDEVLKSLADFTYWWETLVLWAALAGGENPARAEAMINSLIDAAPADPSLLAGIILADGLGSEAQFSRWAQLFAGQIAEPGLPAPELEARLARAFAVSRQTGRRMTLLLALDAVAAQAGWLRWERIAAFAELVEPGRTTGEPRKLVASGLVGQLAGRELQSGLGAAVARCLAGLHPLWPIFSSEWALLQLWPSRRRVLGARSQLVVAAGLGPDLVRRFATTMVPADQQSEFSGKFARKFAQYLVRYSESSWAKYMGYKVERSVVRYVASDISCNWALAWGQADFTNQAARSLASDWESFWGTELATNLDPSWTHERARRWIRDCARGWVRNWVLDWGHDLANELSLPSTPEVLDILGFELGAMGWFAPRALLGSTKTIPDDPCWRLMREACRFSLEPDSTSKNFEKSLAVETPLCLDPLWPALARHLARESLPGDRDLLEDAVRNPRDRPEPLRSGLQFIVRGDVIYNDGKVRTLEEICDGSAVDLPLLDDMADEIDLGPDWDKDPEENFLDF